MQIFENYDLTKLNTFGVPAKARFFTELTEEGEIASLLANPVFKENPKLFLGGGSNILFTQNFEGIVVLNKLKGIEVVSEDERGAVVRAMSGEVWHDLVSFAVERGYGGIENLSLVPGTVGGAPMQNIGAYGVELAQTLLGVEVVDIETGEEKTLSREECELGYRDSAFKGSFKGKYFIKAITLKLLKNAEPNISYRVLANHIAENKLTIEGPKDVSEAVSDIRRSKLPDPKVIGNAGSFFKNVFVDNNKLETLLKEYPEMPHFQEGSEIKIPSGWLVEKSGWKGKRVGNVGVHDKQALVLVNHGGATGLEIKALAMEIIDSVYSKFGLKLIPEVNLI